MRIFKLMILHAIGIFYVKSQHKIFHKTKLNSMVLSKSKLRHEISVEGEVYLEKLKVIDENAEKHGQ